MLNSQRKKSVLHQNDVDSNVLKMGYSRGVVDHNGIYKTDTEDIIDDNLSTMSGSSTNIDNIKNKKKLQNEYLKPAISIKSPNKKLSNFKNITINVGKNNNNNNTGNINNTSANSSNSKSGNIDSHNTSNRHPLSETVDSRKATLKLLRKNSISQSDKRTPLSSPASNNVNHNIYNGNTKVNSKDTRYTRNLSNGSRMANMSKLKEWTCTDEGNTFSDVFFNGTANAKNSILGHEMALAAEVNTTNQSYKPSFMRTSSNQSVSSGISYINDTTTTTTTTTTNNTNNNINKRMISSPPNFHKKYPSTIIHGVQGQNIVSPNGFSQQQLQWNSPLGQREDSSNLVQQFYENGNLSFSRSSAVLPNNVNAETIADMSIAAGTADSERNTVIKDCKDILLLPFLSQTIRTLNSIYVQKHGSHAQHYLLKNKTKQEQISGNAGEDGNDNRNDNRSDKGKETEVPLECRIDDELYKYNNITLKQLDRAVQNEFSHLQHCDKLFFSLNFEFESILEKFSSLNKNLQNSVENLQKTLHENLVFYDTTTMNKIVLNNERLYFFQSKTGKNLQMLESLQDKIMNLEKINKSFSKIDTFYNDMSFLQRVIFIIKSYSHYFKSIGFALDVIVLSIVCMYFIS